MRLLADIEAQGKHIVFADANCNRTCAGLANMLTFYRAVVALLLCLLSGQLASGQLVFSVPDTQLSVDFPAAIDQQTNLVSKLATGTEDSGTVQDIDSRVKALERLHAETQGELKKLADAKSKAEADNKKLPNITINGVFQADAVSFDQDDASRLTYGRIENGADFRRARLSAKGAVSDRMDYFLQMDFGFFGRPTFTDVWADFKDAGPLGTVRVGQWKQPFGLETVSSFRYTTFMERSSTFQAFVPFRHIGVGFYDHSQDLNWTWATSYFRTGQDQFGGSLSSNGGNGMATRLTHLLWHGSQGADYLHLGTAYVLNSPPNDRVRFRSIPEIFVGEFVVPSVSPIGTSGQPVPDVANGTPFFVDTGTLTNIELTQTLGIESLWVRGPLSWQSEAMGCFVNTAASGDAFFNGAYSQVGWFLTGEHRPYDRKAGAIDRVLPRNSVSRCGGCGAWELAARWSYLDLNNRGITGGLMQNMTAGLNWYVNPYCKCVFNYIHSWAEARPIRNGVIQSNALMASQASAFGVRCQLDF
ncbi:MAG: porin [Pirellulaceae bacterium]|nr:porin [Pirellulaceae bacterium]